MGGPGPPFSFPLEAAARPLAASALRSALPPRFKLKWTYTVTEHGRAVAELRPLAPVDDPVGRLVAAGVVRPAAGAPSRLPRPVRLDGDRRLSRVLDDLRTDRV